MDIDKPFTIHPQHPDTTISLPWPPVPVYVVLDKRFLGDRVTSYGGALRFTVEEEGGEELPLETMVLFPLVKIEGNGIELNHYQVGHFKLIGHCPASKSIIIQGPQKLLR